MTYEEQYRHAIDIGGMTSRIEIISPDLAKEYLDSLNVNKQRGLKRSVVTRYSLAIKNGDWLLNGEPIIFNENGELTNGQHRLSAIISADQAIPCLVVRNEPDFSTLHDRGASRTTKDTLAANGYRANREAYLIPALFRYDNFFLNANKVETTPHRTLSDLQIVNFYNDNREQIELVGAICRTSSGRKNTTSSGMLAGVFSIIYTCGNDVSNKLAKYIQCIDDGGFDSDDRKCIPAWQFLRSIDAYNKKNTYTTDSKNIFVQNIFAQSFKDYVNAENRKQVYKLNSDKDTYFARVSSLLLPRYKAK